MLLQDLDGLDTVLTRIAAHPHATGVPFCEFLYCDRCLLLSGPFGP